MKHLKNGRFWITLPYAFVVAVTALPLILLLRGLGGLFSVLSKVSYFCEGKVDTFFAKVFLLEKVTKWVFDSESK